MSTARPNNINRLLSQAATAARPNLPDSAFSCSNLPKPASLDPISQIEPSAHAPLVSNFKTDEEIRQWINALRARSTPPAQTRPNLPKPASSTPIPQNEPTAPLPPRQLHAARLLIAGHTVKAVAETLNVNPHTVSDWKKRPQFRQEIQHLLTKSKGGNK